ncbi:hypothetical protein GGS23DRAFT_619885 [Durotheca rogersii]|uniref:uncharacterized protein n=1 Tax=Durotheca rogersii TaxID=419775 RepID=UPI002220520B|nr:uncharacterized protein GGS23DRAFT_619885 [Durotheca rogersii]KAI5864089.1 hypothetical protein GGS23DRAFT_619885 [Durotheca rogersii]
MGTASLVSSRKRPPNARQLVLVVSGIFTSLCAATVFINHNQDREMESHDVGMLSLTAGTLFFVAAALSKTSFAITLTRLAGPKLKATLWVIIGSMNVTTILSVSGTCWNRTAILCVTIFAAAYSAIMDFVLAALPWAILVKLRIHTSEKVGISIAMSMGTW